ncbi:MAG TPA: TerC family protein, partial [Spirochaetia bacterium]|nr:TerC family protein [Spirochaetia bacterium]
MHTVAGPALWAGFFFLVAVMLALDLGVFHRKRHAIGFREALIWSIVWIGLAMGFGAGVWARFGADRGMEFLTGYVLEKALSIDNLFVFVLIFSTFGVPASSQHRVLFWGILGALVLRGAFIFGGGAVLEAFHWAIYAFGGILFFTGGKLLIRREAEHHPERNPVTRLAARLLPMSMNSEAPGFLVRDRGRLLFTPLFLALVTVEASDIVFAVDSIPAVFAVTRDPFIVFTSNIFAILGLRSLYFLLAGVMGRFRYLRIGLAAVLLFVGAKMLLSSIVTVPIGLSLGVVAATIAVSVIASLARTPGPLEGRKALPRR